MAHRSPRRRVSYPPLAACVMALALAVTAGERVRATDGSGSSQENAGLSCKAILAAGLTTGDGVYWIDPNGGDTGDAFQAYCDMTTDGGGWTLGVNSVAGSEPPTNDMTSNTNTAGIATGHTRNLTNLAINRTAEIRYVIDNPAQGRVYHAKFAGRYHNTLPIFTAWTTLPGHTGGADSMLANQFGRAWTTSLSDRDTLSGASCFDFYNVPWHHGNCWSSIPSNPNDGFTQGPVTGITILARFSIFVREVETLTVPPIDVAPAFLAAQNRSVGRAPVDVAIADFDQDGALDVVTANVEGNNVTVRYAAGPVAQFAAGATPVTVATGLFNGDARPDFAVLNPGPWTATVFNSTPTSFSTSTVPVCPEASSLATGDMDGNGTTDLVMNCPTGNAVGVAFGNGSGGFSFSLQISTGASPIGVAAGDVNGDGRPDIVAALGSNDCVLVLANLPIGYSQTSVCSLTAPINAAIGDLNGDGRPDLAVGSTIGVHILENSDGVNFTATGLLPAVDQINALGLADLNEDGVLDIAAAINAGTRVPVWLGNGDATFGAPAMFDVSATVWGLAIADMSGSGNGNLDIVTADRSTDSVSVLFNLFVPKHVPQITWPTPAAIVYGTPLSGTQLNAESETPGTFTYNPAAGTVLGAGAGQTLSLTFTPDDTVHNESATASVLIDVLQASTTTALTATPAMVAALQPFKLTATVGTSAPGAGVPTGTVTFFDGATPIGSAAVSAGVASLTVNGSAPGAHAFTATFTGDGNFAASTSTPASVTVRDLAQSTFTFAFPTNNPTALGQRATLGAVVLPLGGSVTPTGSVAFLDGGTLLGTAPLSGGVAQFTTTTLGVGPHFIIAIYLGNATFGSSVSSPTVHNVFSGTPPLAAPMTLAASSATPTPIGDPVTFTVTITPASGTPTGSVVFLVDNTLLATATLSSVGGMVQAQVTTSGLSAGVHVVSAIYVGNGVFGAAAAGPIVHKVQ